MHLSHLSALGIHCLAYLSLADRPYVEAGEIRRVLQKSFGLKMQGISYFYYLTARLVDAGLVEGKRGPGGGLKLAQPAARISLRRVVEAVEGPVVEKRCAMSYKDQACKLKRRCLIDQISRQITAQAAKILDQMTVAQFARKMKPALK